MGEYVTVLTSQEELKAKMMPLLNSVSILQKNIQYKELLVQNKLLSENNEVFIDYNLVLENELEKIKMTSTPAMLVAIAFGSNDKKIPIKELEKMVKKDKI